MLYEINSVNYNNIFLNEINYPFSLKFPTINPTCDQECTWIPFMAIVFPGMIISYLRRFDSGRGSTLYLITAIATFFVGTLLWMLIIFVWYLILPIGFISGFSMFTLLILFAYRRQELQVLWDGKFYDEEFVDRGELDSYQKIIELQAGKDEDVKVVDSILLEGLKRNSKESESSNISQGGGTSEIKARDFSDIKGSLDPRDEALSRENSIIFEVKEEKSESSQAVR